MMRRHEDLLGRPFTKGVNEYEDDGEDESKDDLTPTAETK